MCMFIFKSQREKYVISGRVQWHQVAIREKKEDNGRDPEVATEVGVSTPVFLALLLHRISHIWESQLLSEDMRRCGLATCESVA